jgi:hypothetical protein
MLSFIFVALLRAAYALMEMSRGMDNRGRERRKQLSPMSIKILPLCSERRHAQFHNKGNGGTQREREREHRLQ